MKINDIYNFYFSTKLSRAIKGIKPMLKITEKSFVKGRLAETNPLIDIAKINLLGNIPSEMDMLS